MDHRNKIKVLDPVVKNQNATKKQNWGFVTPWRRKAVDFQLVDFIIYQFPYRGISLAFLLWSIHVTQFYDCLMS